MSNKRDEALARARFWRDVSDWFRGRCSKSLSEIRKAAREQSATTGESISEIRKQRERGGE